ncbi:MAG: response regulator [Clostridia bacterium]|nr:response regulator [Clostridia bacterium]
MINVLIAEDDERMNVLLCEYINNQKDMHCVGSAKNGKQCVSMVKQFYPDAILLDIIMPETDGLGVLNELRNIPNKPIIIITSAIFKENTIKISLDLGAEYYIRKPYDIDHVIERIRELASQKDVNTEPVKLAKIDKTLALLGIPKGPKGYVYLREMLFLFSENNQITLNEAYKAIADKYLSN